VIEQIGFEFFDQLVFQALLMFADCFRFFHRLTRNQMAFIQGQYSVPQAINQLNIMGSD
jgi:hypothetical protein